MEYYDIFFKYDLDLGCLILVIYKIDIKDNLFVKYKMRRILFGF